MIVELLVGGWITYLLCMSVAGVIFATHNNVCHLPLKQYLAWMILFAVPVALALAAFLLFVWQPPLDGIPDF